MRTTALEQLKPEPLEIVCKMDLPARSPHVTARARHPRHFNSHTTATVDRMQLCKAVSGSVRQTVTVPFGVLLVLADRVFMIEGRLENATRK